jgi:hypothetical protein
MDEKCYKCGNPRDDDRRMCSECRRKRKEKSKEMRQNGLCTNCFGPSDGGRRWCEKCRKMATKSSMARMRSLMETGRCVDCREPLDCKSKSRCKTCLSLQRDARTKTNRLRRFRILQAYGGKCVCCGETIPQFLNIDHINNDGAKHRREIGGSSGLQIWIEKNNYPKDFQILCYNCNVGKYLNGGVCPHKGFSGTNRVGPNPRC